MWQNSTKPWHKTQEENWIIYSFYWHSLIPCGQVCLWATDLRNPGGNYERHCIYYRSVSSYRTIGLVYRFIQTMSGGFRKPFTYCSAMNGCVYLEDGPKTADYRNPARSVLRRSACSGQWDGAAAAHVFIWRVVASAVAENWHFLFVVSKGSSEKISPMSCYSHPGTQISDVQKIVAYYPLVSNICCSEPRQNDMTWFSDEC
jgi:hypothetical protein